MAGLPKAFRERIVIDLELRDFFVLVGRNGDELGLLEHVRSEG